jgi:hypothetical protein
MFCSCLILIFSFIIAAILRRNQLHKINAFKALQELWVTERSAGVFATGTVLFVCRIF